MKKYIKINGNKLKKYIEDNNIGISNINKFLGRSDSYIYNVLKNNSMRGDDYIALCNELEIDPITFATNKNILIGITPTKINSNVKLTKTIYIEVNYTHLKEFLKENKISIALLSEECKLEYSTMSRYFTNQLKMPIFYFLVICDQYTLNYLEYSSDEYIYDIHKYIYNIRNGYVNINGEKFRKAIQNHKKSESTLSKELYKDMTKLSTNINNNRIELKLLNAVCRDNKLNPNDFIVENELYHEYLDFYSNLFGKELESFESQKVEEIEDKTIKEEKTIEEHKPIDIQFKQKMTLNIDGENKEYFLLDATSYQENIEKIKDYVTKLEEQLAIIKTLF